MGFCNDWGAIVPREHWHCKEKPKVQISQFTRNQKLWWSINTEEISDQDLRKWASQHMIGHRDNPSRTVPTSVFEAFATRLNRR